MASVSDECTRGGPVRQTVSLPRDHHELLQQVAAEKKVSVSWVIRDAVEEYLKDRWPLLHPDD